MSDEWVKFWVGSAIIHIVFVIWVLVEMNSSRYDEINDNEKIVKNKGVFWLLILTGGYGAVLFFFPIFLGRLFTRLTENYDIQRNKNKQITFSISGCIYCNASFLLYNNTAFLHSPNGTHCDI